MKTIRQILAFLIAAILAVLKGIWRLFCAIFRGAGLLLPVGP